METDEYDSDNDEGYEADTVLPEQDVQGVILVQLILLSSFNDESCSIYDHVYLQLTSGKYVKRTHVMPFLTHKEVLIDAVQHFPVNIPVSKAVLKNTSLKIEMIMYKANKENRISIEKRQMGVMLFHLKDIMSNRTIMGGHEFSKDMTSMAKLELKLCYTSGFFGFGNSRRINFEADSRDDEYPANLEEQLLLSLFPRYKPPPQRADDKIGGLLSVKETPIPDILPMFHDPDEPQAAKFMNPSYWEKHPCKAVMRDHERPRRLRSLYLACDSYHLRRMFLEKLVYHNQELTYSDIQRYKTQKEETFKDENILVKLDTMNEPGFSRRMSSTVNPTDLKLLCEEADKKLKMLAGKVEQDSDSSEDSDGRRNAEIDIEKVLGDSGVPLQSKWGKVKTALKGKKLG